ncbi:hypothetical protein [Maritimibacter sp. 55A14]|nr:hypothetical protein [Maritimibacter sp. 55A14]
MLTLRPVTIGDALTAAQPKTIHPQPRDMPLGLISTGTGVHAERELRP